MQTQSEIFHFLFERDLKKLEKEISEYPDEDTLWVTSGTIANAPGNLCLHLCGNLQHYIGAILGETGYVRDRPAEFAARGVKKQTLILEIQKTRESVLLTLGKLSDEELKTTYPEQVLGYPMTTLFFLTHLFGHFGYHLGQINYHRRLLTSSDQR